MNREEKALAYSVRNDGGWLVELGGCTQESEG